MVKDILGILRPTAGSIRIAGVDIGTDPIAAKRVTAFLPDEPKLFEYLTVKEHLNFVARLYAVQGWEEKAKALLEELELSGKETSLPGELREAVQPEAPHREGEVESEPPIADSNSSNVAWRTKSTLGQ